MDLGIAGRTAIVCAASKGLGKGCAMALAEEGVNLVINARSERALGARLRAALPDMLLKLQRREFFRAETSVSRPVKCSIPLPDGGDLQVNLFDISLGGVGLTGFPDDYPIEIGKEVQGCTLTLPDVGVLAVTLQFRNAVDIPLRDGRVNHRAGCKFKSLPAGAENMVQRYIIRLERERRTKLA